MERWTGRSADTVQRRHRGLPATWPPSALLGSSGKRRKMLTSMGSRSSPHEVLEGGVRLPSLAYQLPRP